MKYFVSSTFVFSSLLIKFVATFPVDIASGQPSTGQRHAVLAVWSGTGGNTRYETMANNFLDANGDPVRSKANSRKLPEGSIVYDCVDVIGHVQQDGTEYGRPNGHFRYKCNNGIEEVVACIASQRANSARIAVGESMNVNGFWHRCDSNKVNRTTVYTQEPACVVNGKLHHVGEEIQAGFTRQICQEHGFKVAGCYYLDKDNKLVSMEPSTSVSVGPVTHDCVMNSQQMTYSARNDGGCIKHGKPYKEGEATSANHLHYKCTNGIMDITGCYINETRDLEIGRDVVERGMAYRCYRQNGLVNYHEFACGFNGTPSCKLDEIVSEKAAENPSDRGFSAFSVVELKSSSDGRIASGSDSITLNFQQRMRPQN